MAAAEEQFELDIITPLNTRRLPRNPAEQEMEQSLPLVPNRVADVLVVEEKWSRNEQHQEAFYQRAKQYKDIRAKQKEIFALRERLLQLRWDKTHAEADVIRDVKNIGRELGRLEEELVKLQEESAREFEESLELHKLGLNLHSFYGLTKRPRARTIDFTKESTETSSSNTETQQKGVMAPNEVPAPKLMRTRSTNELKNKPPAEKWKGLFRMFREWRSQKQIAEAQQIVLQEKSIKKEEIIKLRSAIYSLQQRKRLSETDHLLLRKLQQRLKKLGQ